MLRRAHLLEATADVLLEVARQPLLGESKLLAADCMLAPDAIR